MKSGTTLGERITVVPLDDARLANIERRLVGEAGEAAARGHTVRTAWRYLAGAIAAAALVAAGVVGWLLHAPSAVVADEPAAIRVDHVAQRTRLELGDARIDSDPNTAFVVTRPSGGVLIALSRGKVELEVDKRGTRAPLIVRAGETDVIVVGTQFSVAYDDGDGHGEVDVRVREGVVRVVHRAREVRVSPGQGWRTSSGLIASEPSAPAQIASAATEAEAAREPQAAVGPVEPVEPVAQVASAPVRSSTVKPEAVRPRGANAATASGSNAPAARWPSTSRGELLAAVRAQPVEPALDVHEADPARAIARYYEIAAHRSGAEASRAFYSIAVVRHAALAKHGEALDTLDAYLRRFPTGQDLRAALWLRVRILCRDNINDGCRSAAHSYLHAAPDGAAAGIAERLTVAE